MRSSGGPDGPVSVADLLTRHGHVLPADPADRPVAERAGSGRSFPARWRRTLVAVGSVVAAGSVLGGAVVVSMAGHDAPLPRSPGGLLDQLTRGPATAGDPEGGPDTSGRWPVDTDPAGSGGGAAPGRPLPAGAGPAQRGGVGGQATSPSVGAAPVAPSVAVRPQPADEPDARQPDRAAADRADPAEQRAVAPATGPLTSGSGAPVAPPSAGGAPTGAGADPAPAPAGATGGTGPVGGLVGGVGDTVGGLLGK